MRIEKEQAVAIVVDYQAKLLPVMNESEKLLHNSKIFLEGLKTLGVPMYITQQYTKGLGTSVKEITDAIEDTAYTDKWSFTAYDCVKEQIADKKFVVVCGIEAHICVLQTVVDLKAAGHIPVLVADCISSRKELDKQVALERARQEGAIVTTYESLLFELLKVAGTQESKMIQKLIR